jgi:hypothetical protein
MGGVMCRKCGIGAMAGATPKPCDWWGWGAEV